MILNLDKWKGDAVAAIDSQGQQLTYGELRDFAKMIEHLMPARSLMFLLVENNVGGIAWTIGNICAGNVPLILNAHLDEGLYKSLYELYQPPFVCVPEAMADKYGYETVISYYGYTLMKTGYEACPMNDELSHLLPTSGSTGSPKLVRHKYDNIEAAALNISTFFQLTEKDRPLMVLPLYYTMGLSMVFSHFYVGATVLITNLNMTDRNFWKFIKEERATSFTGVPYRPAPPDLADTGWGADAKGAELEVCRVLSRQRQTVDSYLRPVRMYGPYGMASSEVGYREGRQYRSCCS